MKTLARTDREEIADLLIQYARAVDDGPVADLLALFTDDVVLEGPLSGVHEGRDGVLAWLQSVPDRPHGQPRHIISNIAVRGTGQEAQVDAYFLHFHTPTPANGEHAKTEFLYSGRYDCNVRRVGGRWLISRRAAVIDSLA